MVRRREVLVTPGSDGPAGHWMAMSCLRHGRSTRPFNCHQCFRTGATINGFPLLNGAGMARKGKVWMLAGAEAQQMDFGETWSHSSLHVLCVWWIMWSVIAWSLYLRPDLGWNLSVIIILSHAYFWHVTKYICKSTCWKVPSKCPYVNPLVMVIHVVISVHVCWRVLASVLRINTAITVSLCRFANYTCAVILTKCGEISQVKWSFVYCQ